MSYFASLNGVRFICIALVLWHHSPFFSAMEAPIPLLTRGFVGVDFFFVLSGFLITTLLLREEGRTGRISLGGFYRRRLLRIVPVYFLVISVVAIWFVVLGGRADLAPLLPYYYLFLSNFLITDIPFLSITWSLSVEEQYYLFWPLMLVLLPVMRLRAGLLLALISFFVLASAGVFGSLVLFETAHARFDLAAAGTGYAAILIGALTAIMLHSRRGFGLLYMLLGHKLAPVLAFVAVFAVLAFAPPVLLGWPNLLMHSAMALAIAAVVIREDNLLRPVLAWAPIARVGEISYGIYLYHVLTRYLVVEGLIGFGVPTEALPLWVSLIYPFATILVAEISYRTFERFFLTLKDRPTQRRKLTDRAGRF